MQFASVAALAASAISFAAAAAPQKFGGYGLFPQQSYAVQSQQQGYGLNDLRTRRALNRWNRCDRIKLCYVGHSRVVSNVTVPSGNASEYVTWNSTDSNDWAINAANHTEIVVRNEGVWNVLAQLQLFGKDQSKSAKAVSGAIVDAYFTINGIKMAGSGVAGSVSADVPRQVLTLSMTRKFRKGDRIQIGVASSDSSSGFVSGFDSALTGVSGNAAAITFTRIGGGEKKEASSRASRRH